MSDSLSYYSGRLNPTTYDTLKQSSMSVISIERIKGAIMPDSFDETTPIVHVISDSLGDTACEVVLAAAGQFDEGSIRISRLPKVSHIAQVTSYLDMQSKKCANSAVFHTIVNTDLRHAVMDECVNRNIPNVDLMGPATCIISQLTGKEPHGIPGTINRSKIFQAHRGHGVFC